MGGTTAESASASDRSALLRARVWVGGGIVNGSRSDEASKG